MSECKCKDGYIYHKSTDGYRPAEKVKCPRLRCRAKQIKKQQSEARMNGLSHATGTCPECHTPFRERDHIPHSEECRIIQAEQRTANQIADYVQLGCLCGRMKWEQCGACLTAERIRNGEWKDTE